MIASAITSGLRRARRAAISLGAIVVMAAAADPARASGCSFEPQGEGRVTAVIDARTFRLQDGREIRLAGIEPAITKKAEANGTASLTAIIGDRDVTLRGADDTPDRYGRQPAFVFLASAETSVQDQLLVQGDALVSGSVTEKECAASMAASEASARRARRGTWADPDAIKNAESPGDILARIGQFTVVEGRVLSVRQAGATTYLNFGRNWTRDFAVTISRRMLSAFEAARVVPKSFENRRIRVRGWIEARGGPRIELLRVGQIELAGEN